MALERINANRPAEQVLPLRLSSEQAALPKEALKAHLRELALSRHVTLTDKQLDDAIARYENQQELRSAAAAFDAARQKESLNKGGTAGKSTGTNLGPLTAYRISPADERSVAFDVNAKPVFPAPEAPPITLEQARVVLEKVFRFVCDRNNVPVDPESASSDKSGARVDEKKPKTTPGTTPKSTSFRLGAGMPSTGGSGASRGDRPERRHLFDGLHFNWDGFISNLALAWEEIASFWRKHLRQAKHLATATSQTAALVNIKLKRNEIQELRSKEFIDAVKSIGTAYTEIHASAANDVTGLGGAKDAMQKLREFCGGIKIDGKALQPPGRTVLTDEELAAAKLSPKDKAKYESLLRRYQRNAGDAGMAALYRNERELLKDCPDKKGSLDKLDKKVADWEKDADDGIRRCARDPIAWKELQKKRAPLESELNAAKGRLREIDTGIALANVKLQATPPPSADEKAKLQKEVTDLTAEQKEKQRDRGLFEAELIEFDRRLIMHDPALKLTDAEAKDPEAALKSTQAELAKAKETEPFDKDRVALLRSKEGALQYLRDTASPRATADAAMARAAADAMVSSLDTKLNDAKMKPDGRKQVEGIIGDVVRDGVAEAIKEARAKVGGRELTKEELQLAVRTGMSKAMARAPEAVKQGLAAPPHNLKPVAAQKASTLVAKACEQGVGQEGEWASSAIDAKDKAGEFPPAEAEFQTGMLFDATVGPKITDPKAREAARTVFCKAVGESMAAEIAKAKQAAGDRPLTESELRDATQKGFDIGLDAGHERVTVDLAEEPHNLSCEDAAKAGQAIADQLPALRQQTPAVATSVVSGFQSRSTYEGAAAVVVNEQLDVTLRTGGIKESTQAAVKEVVSETVRDGVRGSLKRAQDEAQPKGRQLTPDEQQKAIARGVQDGLTKAPAALKQKLVQEPYKLSAEEASQSADLIAGVGFNGNADDIVKDAQDPAKLRESIVKGGADVLDRRGEQLGRPSAGLAWSEKQLDRLSRFSESVNSEAGKLAQRTAQRALAYAQRNGPALQNSIRAAKSSMASALQATRWT